MMKKRAAVFAGQGAQAVGMGKDLAEAFPECAAKFDAASSVLGRDLRKICFEGPIEELTRSSNCQPAIFVVSALCYDMLRRQAPDAAFCGAAGLSLGEWTALYAAGVLSFEDTVRVLEARGRFMQEACDEQAGGMVSVLGLSLDALQAVCASAGVQIANINSPEQIVLSGPKQAVLDAEAKAKAAGAKRTIVLPVAGAFHSRLMEPAARKFEAFLSDVSFRAPAVPVVANVTGQPHGAPDAIKAAMVQQITSSVQWVASVEWFRHGGVTEYVEFGPGKVLAGLIKRIDAAAVAHNVADRAGLDKTAAALKA